MTKYIVYRSHPFGPVKMFDSEEEAVAFGRQSGLGPFVYGKGWHLEIYDEATATKLMNSYVPGSDGGFRLCVPPWQRLINWLKGLNQ